MVKVEARKIKPGNPSLGFLQWAWSHGTQSTPHLLVPTPWRSTGKTPPVQTTDNLAATPAKLLSAKHPFQTPMLLCKWTTAEAWTWMTSSLMSKLSMTTLPKEAGLMQSPGTTARWVMMDTRKSSYAPLLLWALLLQISQFGLNRLFKGLLS